jgi:hypothetical protein
MTTLNFREHDRLDGASNFTPWKYRLQIVLEEAEIWWYIEKDIVISPRMSPIVIMFMNCKSCFVG